MVADVAEVAGMAGGMAGLAGLGMRRCQWSDGGSAVDKRAKRHGGIGAACAGPSRGQTWDVPCVPVRDAVSTQELMYSISCIDCVSCLQCVSHPRPIHLRQAPPLSQPPLSLLAPPFSHLCYLRGGSLWWEGAPRRNVFWFSRCKVCSASLPILLSSQTYCIGS